MSAVLSIENVMAKVAQRFAAEGPHVTQLFGWHASKQQVEGDTITWAPGDPSGKVGTTSGAIMPGRHPRSLATLYERFTVTISASDPNDPENEAAQYRAVWLLRNYWFRAVYHAAHGTFEIVDEQWLTERGERRYGAALQITLALQAAMLDVPPSAAATKQVRATHAEVALSASDTGAPVHDVYQPAEES
jgi:hypothetical protein